MRPTVRTDPSTSPVLSPVEATGRTGFYKASLLSEKESTMRQVLLFCSAITVSLCLNACESSVRDPSKVEQTSKFECVLKSTAEGYGGTCQVPCSVNALAVNFDGVDVNRACSGAPRTVDATLARTDQAQRWLGTMRGVQPEDPTRLEVVPNKLSAGSVARTPYGWFNITGFDESERGLRLVMDASKQVRPTNDDVAILQRAIALIPDREAWNKNDNRQCSPGSQKLSLFCALMRATTDISGGVHYRQPAMQAVREELNLVDASRIKTHRIMDFNNHPDTTLEEIHALLLRASARVTREIR
jgi:hypothetical protein